MPKVIPGKAVTGKDRRDSYFLVLFQGSVPSLAIDNSSVRDGSKINPKGRGMSSRLNSLKGLVFRN